MQIKDFFWQYFQHTGGVGAYLIYKQMLVEDEDLIPKVVPEEE
ncbi:MAG: YqzL family protein [Peptococcales bacterium]